MKLLLTALILFPLSTLFAQTVVVSVKDDQNNFINNYSLYRNSNQVGESTGGIYILKCLPNDTIMVKKEGRISEPFIVPSGKDTIYKTFYLTSRIQEIDEVSVTYEKYVKVAGENNENIIDFYFTPENRSFILLKSVKGNYFIEKKEADRSESRSLWFTPKSLFMDVMGNTHILSKDSSYQIYLEDSISFITTLPIKLFESKIKALVTKTSDHLFYQNFTQHNKSYTLSKTDFKNEISVVTEVFDEVAFKVATHDYNEIINLYYAFNSPSTNIIENGIWDGNVVALGYPDTIVRFITWYLHISSRPIECYSFGRMDHLLLVNFYEQQLETYDFRGQLLNVIDLEPIELKNREIVYDYFFDSLYIFGTNKGSPLLYKFNLTEGKMQQVAYIDELKPSHTKVVGKEVFFLSRNDAGYNKLYRMRI